MSLRNVPNVDFKRNLQTLIDLGVLNKTSIGLDQVDNTSDPDKPVSTQTQNALATKLNSSLVGMPNGIAQLDSNSKLTSSQIPNLTLSNLTDVGITNPQNDQILKYNGSFFVSILLPHFFLTFFSKNHKMLRFYLDQCCHRRRWRRRRYEYGSVGRIGTRYNHYRS